MLDRFIPGIKQAIDRQRINSEYILHGKPVLFLPGAKKDAEFPDIVDEFERRGYSILENLWLKGHSIRIPSNNPCLGYFADARFLDITAREAMFDTVDGLRRPQQYTFEEALNLDTPVVAKDLTTDRGEGVIYLKDKEALEKFAAWRAFVYQKTDNQDTIGSAGTFMRFWLDIQNENWDVFRYIAPEGWVFQEYIETPSKFHTSFRILVDGYGSIHYATLLRSPGKKRERKLGEVGYKAADEGYSLLFNPKSKLFLDAPNIVSNARQGGIAIQLNSKLVDDETNREVLREHGINPDNPQIPTQLAKIAVALAILSKGFFPFWGIDFIYDKNHEVYFLEANVWPTLFAEGLGVTQEEINKNVPDVTDREQVQKYLRKILIGRMAQTARKMK